MVRNGHWVKYTSKGEEQAKEIKWKLEMHYLLMLTFEEITRHFMQCLVEKSLVCWYESVIKSKFIDHSYNRNNALIKGVLTNVVLRKS